MTLHSINEAFQPFEKIARLSRNMVISEKIDGTNAQVVIEACNWNLPPSKAVCGIQHDGAYYAIYAGSRTRYLQPGKETDNFGFAEWVKENAGELVKLGVGRHYGEWWGRGINRGYGLADRRFSLFNTARWSEDRPVCCHVVPVLHIGNFDTNYIEHIANLLCRSGSAAAPGFMKPEGIVIWHEAARQLFKKTIENDEAPKSLALAA